MEIEMNIKKCKSTQTKVMRVTLNFDKLIKNYKRLKKIKEILIVQKQLPQKFSVKKIENAGGLKDK